MANNSSLVTMTSDQNDKGREMKVGIDEKHDSRAKLAEHQHGCRDVSREHSINLNAFVSFQWNDHDAPESAPFPGKYEESLTDFQRLLLLRCFRVDRVYLAITNFVTGRMSEKYVTPPAVSYTHLTLPTKLEV